MDSSTRTTEARNNQVLENEGFARRKILTDSVAVNKISIPLNLCSYFAAFKNNLHPNIKTNLIIKLEKDNNTIFRKTAARASKVILTKLRLWCPKIIFNGSGMKQYLANYLKLKKWTYLKEHGEIIQTQSNNSYFRISTGITRPGDMCLFGLFLLLQNIIIKNKIYSLLIHLTMEQIILFFLEHNWKLIIAFTILNWK